MARGHPVGTLLMVAALALVVSGCRQATLKGQIDLPDGAVRDIAVRVIPEKDVKPYLDGKAAAARVALNERTTAVERARLEWTGSCALGSSLPEGRRRPRAGPGHRSREIRTGCHADRPSTTTPTKYTKAEAMNLARARDEEASRKRAAKAGQFADDNQRLADAMTRRPTRYEDAHARLLAWETEMLADLPKKGSVVYTNGKGHFTTTVPRGDRVAVFASGEVTIDGLPQRRAWGLWVNADAVEKPVTLDAKEPSPGATAGTGPK